MQRLSSPSLYICAAACLTVFLLIPVEAHEGLHEQIAEVTRQIKREPKNPSLYLKRGELYRLHHDWNAARADYSRVQRLDPRLNTVKFALGRMYFDLGKLPLAKTWLDRYLAVEPDHVDALVERARLLVRMDRRLAAAKDYTHAIERSPKPNPEVYIARARAVAEEGGEFVNEALRGIDEGIGKMGPLVTLELVAIELELRIGRHDAALARIDLISAQTPRKETWLARRGEILLAAGRANEARDAFSASLAALESLPERIRKAKATIELENRVRAALATQSAHK